MTKAKQPEPPEDAAGILGEDVYTVADILTDGAADPLETEHMPAGRALRTSHRRRFERIRQREQLLEVIPKPPEPGETIHVIGTGLYDFWTFVPQMLSDAWLGATEELYCSTWTLCRANAVELFELSDNGRIGRISFLTGLYFKRRETAIYTFLLEGLRARRGRYRAFLNHAKVLLAANPDRSAYLAVAGSANLTANPRLENYTFTNDRAVYDFHRAWMEEAFSHD